MPIYEYFCVDCKTKFEAIRSMSAADDPIKCENCDGEHTNRAVSAAFALSGSQTGTNRQSASASGCGSCAGGSCSTCGV